MLRRPETIEDFLALPSRRQWTDALHSEWDGPDGSSASTDTICGVRIGAESAAHRYAKLPANLHDWRYFLGRHFNLPESWRQRADIGYRDGCMALIEQRLDGFVFLTLGKLIAHVRYFTLRLFGRKAWRHGSGRRQR